MREQNSIPISIKTALNHSPAKKTCDTPVSDPSKIRSKVTEVSVVICTANDGLIAGESGERRNAKDDSTNSAADRLKGNVNAGDLVKASNELPSATLITVEMEPKMAVLKYAAPLQSIHSITHPDK